jgi:hypothetical protein
MQFIHGVNEELKRTKWEAELYKKELMRHHEALKVIRMALQNKALEEMDKVLTSLNV